MSETTERAAAGAVDQLVECLRHLRLEYGYMQWTEAAVHAAAEGALAALRSPADAPTPWIATGMDIRVPMVGEHYHIDCMEVDKTQQPWRLRISAAHADAPARAAPVEERAAEP